MMILKRKLKKRLIRCYQSLLVRQLLSFQLQPAESMPLSRLMPKLSLYLKKRFVPLSLTHTLCVSFYDHYILWSKRTEMV